MPADHALEHTASRSEVRRAEKDPGKIDEREGQEDARSAVNPVLGMPIKRSGHLPPTGLPGQKRAVEQSPQDEGPARAVPEAAQKERKQNIRQLTRRAAAIASERNVDIVAQEAGQRHVPAPPKLGNGVRAIGG